MEIDRHEEKFISGLYRHYQENRDDIDQQALFNINKAVKVYINSTASVDNDNATIYQHQVMTAIREQAHHQYIKNRITPHSIPIQDKHTQSTGSPSLFQQLFQSFIAHIKKPVWVAALTGLLIILFYFIDFNALRSPSTEGFINPYQSTQLMRNDEFVANQINTQIDWQYGFVIEDPSGRNAFVAGAYLVDLQNLSQSKRLYEIELLIEQLSEINTRIGDEAIQSAIEQFKLQANQPESLLALNKSFEIFYQSQPQGDFFEFGKWMEFNYLQTKLALALDDLSLYNGDIQAQHDFIKAFKLRGVYPEFINNDIDQLIDLYSLKNPSLEHLRKQYKLLEKLRTLLF